MHVPSLRLNMGIAAALARSAGLFARLGGIPAMPAFG
jgi:hypothetical protein